MNREREKELYRSQLETLHEEIAIYTKALTDIVSCNIPNVPAGVTISMEQFGPFARMRADQALKATDYYRRINE